MHIKQINAKYQIKRGNAKVWSYTNVLTPTFVNIFLIFNLFFKNKCDTSKLPRCQRCLCVYNLLRSSIGSTKKIASSQIPTFVFNKYFIWNVICVSSQIVSVLYNCYFSTTDLRNAENAPDNVYTALISAE